MHLRRLGELIGRYGGNPKLLSFAGGRPHWWSSGVVSYEKDRDKMLRQAIAGEREAIRAYRQLAARMDDSRVRSSSASFRMSSITSNCFSARWGKLYNRDKIT